jgi:hypothetical protein
VADRSQCRQCGTAPQRGANFCLECGASVTPLVVDLLGVDEPPLPSSTDVTPHPRRGLWAVLALFAGMVLVLWGLTRGVDRTNDEPLGVEVPEEGISAVELTTSTMVVATTTSTSTTVPTTSAEQLFMNNVPGPVLGDDVEGVLVSISSLVMQQIDLSTGAIERIDLEHTIPSEDSQSGVVINGKLVGLSVLGRLITITDLSDGSQREPRDISDGSLDWHVAGRAGVDSVWLETHREPDQTSEAIEVDFEGEVRRRVEIPQPFSIRWADGDELILESPDGSFHYDTHTSVVERMPGQVVAFEPGFVMTASCDESLRCNVLVDRGSGSENVDWLRAGEVFDGSIDLSPDLSGALLHTYTQAGGYFAFIDLHTGSRVDLGNLRIDPYRRVVWIEGSRWIIGQNESPNKTWAIDTETGTQLELNLESGVARPFQGPFLAFIPPDRPAAAAPVGPRVALWSHTRRSIRFSRASRSTTENGPANTTTGGNDGADSIVDPSTGAPG